MEIKNSIIYTFAVVVILGLTIAAFTTTKAEAYTVNHELIECELVVADTYSVDHNFLEVR